MSSPSAGVFTVSSTLLFSDATHSIGKYIVNHSWFQLHLFFRVHVRRTDKINLEASFHSVSEYMVHVAAWYDKYDLENHGDKKTVKRRVYLASDDPSVIEEFNMRYETTICDTKVNL